MENLLRCFGKDLKILSAIESATAGVRGRSTVRCARHYMRRVHALARHLEGRSCGRAHAARSFSVGAAEEQKSPVALIVGAGDATGGAIARRFARDGFTVCAVRRNGDKLTELVESIESSGGSALAYG